jgi:hypothetical protein
MAWTIHVEDGAVHVRAIISDRASLLDLIKELTARSQDNTFTAFGRLNPLKELSHE